MRATPAGLLAAAWLLALPATGHEILHTEVDQQALVVQLSYADGSPFAFEAYEVSRDGDTVPRQVGRTDHAGRIAFLPDGPGNWRIKAFSEDGHGLDIRVESGAAGAAGAAERPAVGPITRILVGVSIILGLFGFLKLYSGRRQT